ncbi:hypothetical protein DPMN_032063 [Dreissena polymorpha]|uniref:Uncharacterized protein n=1 Tax=Dreissena polymorpha TaxID=45954 RepID=A0A9D4M3K4_DREPO|nr:hypothetical protein DPMN_032063 [Dreissena polymorpha]
MQARTATIRIEEPFRKTWREPVTIISAEELKRAESGDSIDGAEIDSINSNSRHEQKGVSEIVKRITPSMPDIRIISDEKQSEQNNNNENLNPSCKDVIFRTPQKRSCEMMNVSHCLSSDFHKAYSDSYLCEKSDWMLGERSSSRSPPSPSVGSRSPQIRSRSPIVNKSPSVRHASSEFNFSPESTEHYRCEVEAESQRVKNACLKKSRMVPTSPAFLKLPTTSRETLTCRQGITAAHVTT